MAFVRLIFFLWIGVISFVTIGCVDCSNEAGHCNFYTSDLYCYITTNDTLSIKALLRDCGNNSSFAGIYVYKYYVSNEYGNLLIDIELPTNIQYLYIYNSQDQDHIRLTTFSQNTALTRIDTSSYIELESNDFFTHFTGLQNIGMNDVLSREPPSFTNLYNLTYLRVALVGPVTHALDEGIVSGLTNLVSLSLYTSYFNGINEGAFRNLSKLTYLHLAYNDIAYIEDGALTDLSSLKLLYLYDNGIQIVSDNVFEGLTDLTYLYLNNNPEFPLSALIKAKSVIYLFLQYNGYHTLEPYVFQQMESLEYLYLSDTFVCDCSLQWTSLVGQYGLDIRSAICSESENLFSRLITDQMHYTNCYQTESFQCFSKSITCPDNQVCHNSETSYSCGCSRGYALHSSGQCKDVDECDEMTDCQHTCQNTEGSFHCSCEEGYELADDGYNCNDINECQELNGGCEFGCRNTNGSHQCYCYYGHRLMNVTHCDNEIQYIVLQGIENESFIFSCHTNQNLTIKNFTCENIPPQTTAATTTTPSGCPIGYVQRNTGECVDEDECDFYTNCEHSCVNTEGSFYCECKEGYKLANDGYNCDDFNECHELNGGCEFGCRNTNGSYQCYCYYGLELKNETHCDDEIQCLVQTIDNEDYHITCLGGYNITLTNFNCENITQTSAATSTSTTTTAPSGCPIGYVQRYSGVCVDEDECDFYTNCQHSCVNTEGSFHCECNEGFKLTDDGYSCNDINECHQLNGGCEFGCRNSNGSYLCYCYYGLELKNKTHCDTEIQCNKIQDDASRGNHFTCREGFNLTINNLTCNNSINHTMIQNTENPSSATSSVQFQTSTIIILTILILVIVAQTVIILFLIFRTMKKSVWYPKIHRNMRQGNFQVNAEIPSVDEIIEKQPSLPPKLILENPDNTEENLYQS